MQTALDDQRQLWDKEYRDLQVIPSSTRTLPSKPFLLFAALLRLDIPRCALDAGCGNGRNAIYLAEKGWKVRAVDFSDVALKRLRDAVNSIGVRQNLEVDQIPLSPPLPFNAGAFDLVLDSYVLCHFSDDAFKQKYLD